jgi:hypothetical protein
VRIEIRSFIGVAAREVHEVGGVVEETAKAEIRIVIRKIHKINRLYSKNIDLRRKRHGLDTK